MKGFSGHLTYILQWPIDHKFTQGFINDLKKIAASAYNSTGLKSLEKPIEFDEFFSSCLEKCYVNIWFWESKKANLITYLYKMCFWEGVKIYKHDSFNHSIPETFDIAVSDVPCTEEEHPYPLRCKNLGISFDPVILQNNFISKQIGPTELLYSWLKEGENYLMDAESLKYCLDYLQEKGYSEELAINLYLLLGNDLAIFCKLIEHTKTVSKPFRPPVSSTINSSLHIYETKPCEINETHTIDSITYHVINMMKYNSYFIVSEEPLN